MILLTNIWNRNLKINKKILKEIDLENLWFDENIELIDRNWFITKQYFLQFTEYLNNNFEKFKNYISLNILDKIIDKFDIIYIFTTNQSWPYNNQDTKYEWEIIKKLFHNKEIILKEYTLNPTNRKETFTFFLNFIKSNNNFEGEKVYILWSWWVPAMKEGLNIAWVMYINNCQLVDINEKNWDMQESEVEKSYLKEFDKKIILNLLNNYNYEGIVDLLENSVIENRQLENFVKYCFYRFNFNFIKSNEIYEQYLGEKLKLEEQQFKNWIIDQENYEDIEERVKQDSTRFIELLDNIEITYNKWEYTMLLWKLFRFIEWLNRLLFEKITKVSTNQVKWADKSNIEELYKPFMDYLNNKPSLKEYLEDKKIDIQKWVNNYVLFNILEYLFKNDNSIVWNNKKILWKWLKMQKKEKNNKEKEEKNFQFLNEKRNKSIMAHWWEWIDKEDLKEAMEDMLNFKKDLEKYLIWKERENVFDILNKFLKDRINNL